MLGGANFEETVLGDAVNGYSTVGLLLALLKILYQIKMEIQGVLFTKHLKICPKCHSNLKLSSDSETQYCSICKYWTKIGTARLDSIMIFG